MAQARGDFTGAADAYGGVAARWLMFGTIAERAFALLGQGRRLVRLGHGAEAEPALAAAGQIFASLRAAPHLAETEALRADAMPRPA